MSGLAVFNYLSVDGYFIDGDGDMSWAHQLAPDPEFDAFIASNAQSTGRLLLGRATYELLSAFWTSAAARERMAAVADGINRMTKYVVSDTLDKATWNNTTIIRSDLAGCVRELKQGTGELVVLGSGTVVAQLAKARLIDEYRLMICPIVLGNGHTLFEGVPRFTLQQPTVRTFANGMVLLSYQLNHKESA